MLIAMSWLEVAVGIASILLGALILFAALRSFHIGMTSGAGLHSGGRHMLYVGSVLIVLPAASSIVVNADGFEYKRLVHDKVLVEQDFAKAAVEVADLKRQVAELSNTPTVTPPPTPDCPGDEEAKANIRWVVAGDAGARSVYSAARNAGQSPYFAVLQAQSHNANSQASIQRFGEACTNAFAQALGG